jgi:thiamine kinase-like enzyme
MPSMPTPVIASLEQATPQWLTGVLRREQLLLSGKVLSLESRQGPSTHAQLAWLEVRYSNDAAGREPLPQRLVLKMCSNSDGLFGSSEVDYYRRDYLHAPDAPVPRCFDAAHHPASGRYHVLMEDLSGSHTDSWQCEPDLRFALKLAEALAALHQAHWSRAPASDAAIERYLAHVRSGLEPMLAASADSLSAAEVELVRQAFEHHPQWMRLRARQPQGMSLIHGDLNPGNILAPNEPSGRVYFIDRQPFDWSLTQWLAVSDLCYAVVHWWPIEQRRALERPMLARYHECLLRAGCTDYPWELLWHDYRLCTVQSLYVAADWCTTPADVEDKRWVWWPQLQKALQAVQDLDASALWRQRE